MPSTIARRVLAAAAVLTTLLTGCSPTGSADAGSPATGASGKASGDTQSRPSGDSETSATARPDQPIYYDRDANRGSGLKSDLEWHGGMIHSGATKMPNLSITGWMPGLAEFATCEIDLSAEDDADFSTSADDMAQLWSDTPLPRAIATTGDQPRAYVTYAASTKASGSSPSEERVYVQSIDLATCTAGERIDVLGEPLDDPVKAAPAFVGATEDTLGISIFGQHIDRKTESAAPSVVGFNVKDSSLAWTLPSPGKQVLFEPLDAAGLFAVHLNSLDADKNSLLSVQTGKPIAETVAESKSNSGPAEFGEPTLDWGEGKYLYSTHSYAEAQQFIVDGDKTTPVTDPVFNPDGVGFDTDQNQIVVGFSDADDSADGLVVLDESGATKSIMSRDEFSDRSAEIMGIASGLVYLRTSDGRITVDLEGEIVGDPLDIDEHPLLPDSQRIVGGQVVTLWTTKELLSRHAPYPAAVTLDPAVVPGAGPSDSSQ